MSKIVFWSPLHGQGQTSNLHLLALIISLLYKKKILLMQTHISMNNLEGPLVGRNVDPISNESDIFQDIGLDAAVMYSRINMLKESTLESCCITFPDISLLLLPGTGLKNREIFDRDIGKNLLRMTEQAGNYVDIVMIDANSGNDDLSFRLMESADLVIVNLTQRRHVLGKFFQEYESRFDDFNKVFFLFGNYDKNSGYNIDNCRRRYRKYINNSNSGVIPYSTQYMDAQNECEILKMVREGLDTSKLGQTGKIKKTIKSRLRLSRYSGEETDYFFNQACSSAAKIMNMLNMAKNKSHVKRSGA